MCKPEMRDEKVFVFERRASRLPPSASRFPRPRWASAFPSAFRLRLPHVCLPPAPVSAPAASAIKPRPRQHKSRKALSVSGKRLSLSHQLSRCGGTQNLDAPAGRRPRPFGPAVAPTTPKPRARRVLAPCSASPARGAARACLRGEVGVVVIGPLAPKWLKQKPHGRALSVAWREIPR